MNARVDLPLNPVDEVIRQLQSCDGIDPAFRSAMSNRAPATDADKIRRLRGALSGLLELIASFEDVTLTRDLEKYQAEAVYDAEVQFARQVMKETA